MKDGYDHGYKEGKASAVPVLPSPRFNIKSALILCAVICLAAAAVSGFISGTIGYSNGQKKGFAQASEICESRIKELQAQHQADAKTQEHYQTDIEKAKREGYEQAMMERTTPSPSPAPRELTNTHEPSILSQLN